MNDKQLDKVIKRLASVLDSRKGQYAELGSVADFGSYLATKRPRDIASFEQAIGADAARVAELRAAGLQLVEAVERLVCALYAVEPDLEDEVVASARARGARRAIGSTQSAAREPQPTVA